MALKFETISDLFDFYTDRKYFHKLGDTALVIFPQIVHAFFWFCTIRNSVGKSPGREHYDVMRELEK